MISTKDTRMTSKIIGALMQVFSKPTTKTSQFNSILDATMLNLNNTEHQWEKFAKQTFETEGDRFRPYGLSKRRGLGVSGVPARVLGINLSSSFKQECSKGLSVHVILV
jgi:hypothetical protein